MRFSKGENPPFLFTVSLRIPLSIGYYSIARVRIALLPFRSPSLSLSDSEEEQRFSKQRQYELQQLGYQQRFSEDFTSASLIQQQSMPLPLPQSEEEAGQPPRLSQTQAVKSFKKQRPRSGSINNAKIAPNESENSDKDLQERLNKKKPKEASSPPATIIEEFEDYVVIDGQKLRKPFVEKPMDAEDHNIWIYYPMCDGGGCKKLFRKQGDKSSDFEKNLNSIRKDGNYIYEEFLPTNGFDIKVYCVGQDYAHAEVRIPPPFFGAIRPEM